MQYRRTASLSLVGFIAAVLAPAAFASAPKATLRDDDGALVLTRTVPTDHQGRGVVSFKEEIKSAAYAQQISGRSIEGDAQIDCVGRRFQLKRLVVYALPGRRGGATLQVGDQPDWRTAEPDTTMARVLRAACGPIRAAPMARADPQLALAAPPAAPTSIPVASPAKAPSPPPLAAPPPIPPPAKPNQDSPDLFVTNPFAALGGARPPTVAEQAVSPPALAASDAAFAPAPPAAARPPLAAKPALDPPAPEAAIDQPSPTRQSPAAEQGAFYVQLGSLGSRALAEQAWSTLLRSNPSALTGLREHMEPKHIGTVQFYRVVVGVFPSRRAAEDLCKSLGRDGRACLVRR